MLASPAIPRFSGARHAAIALIAAAPTASHSFIPLALPAFFARCRLFPVIPDLTGFAGAGARSSTP
ncbi:hypothetical protein B0G83_12252 [Paraburkholderia sp. BL21I4N1]|nr:hypothetical protein B0G83_12252 [Paraburkholderia sp. BL21I4N1]